MGFHLFLVVGVLDCCWWPLAFSVGLGTRRVYKERGASNVPWVPDVVLDRVLEDVGILSWRGLHFSPLLEFRSLIVVGSVFKRAGGGSFVFSAISVWYVKTSSLPEGPNHTFTSSNHDKLAVGCANGRTKLLRNAKTFLNIFTVRWEQGGLQVEGHFLLYY